jgi:hypothetical protein
MDDGRWTEDDDNIMALVFIGAGFVLILLSQ